MANHAMDLHRMLSGEQALKHNMTAADAQRIFENTLKTNEDRRAEGKYTAGQGAEDIGSEYVKNGQRFRDITDKVSGKILRTEALGADGDSKDGKDKYQLFQKPDGSQVKIKDGDPIPKGAQAVAPAQLNLSAKDQEGQAGKLARLEQTLTTGVTLDKDGNEKAKLDPQSLTGYAELYNKENPKYAFVPKMEPDTTWYGASTGKMKQVGWSKIDKYDVSQPDANLEQTLPVNPSTGQRFTMAQVRQAAAKRGTSITEALKFLHDNVK